MLLSPRCWRSGIFLKVLVSQGEAGFVGLPGLDTIASAGLQVVCWMSCGAWSLSRGQLEAVFPFPYRLV